MVTNTAFYFCRTYDANRQGINSGLAEDGSFFPFWARKCGCAECIIARDKMEARNFPNNQYGHQGSRQSECYLSQTRNEYNHKHQTKERIEEKQAYNAQLGNGTGSSLWPQKHRFTVSSETVQTRDVNSYLLHHQNNPRVSQIYQANALSQSETMMFASGANSFPLLLNAGSAQGNQSFNYWVWNGSSNEFSYQNQQQLSTTKQTQQLSRDPRLRKQSERFNGNDALTSVYHTLDNAKPVRESEEGNLEGHKQQSKENNSRRHREETERGFVQGSKSAAPNWNVSSNPQYPQPRHTLTNYPERSAPAAKIKDCKESGDKWKDQGSWANKLPQLTLKELSNKRDASKTFLQFTDSHNAIPWNHPYLQGVETCRSSEAESKRAPTAVENFGSRNKRRTSDFDSFQNNNHSLQNKQQWIIENKELENEAKTLEIGAREERIRKLKTLLAKQEQALEALRFQRKPPYPDEKDGKIVNISSSNETLSQKSGDQENIIRSSEESCSSSGANLGNSLKRRWLKNWNEDDQPEHKPAAKKEKENEVHPRGTRSENENQNLSNAEFTALEGLVRLSKD